MLIEIKESDLIGREDSVIVFDKAQKCFKAIATKDFLKDLNEATSEQKETLKEHDNRLDILKEKKLIERVDNFNVRLDKLEEQTLKRMIYNLAFHLLMSDLAFGLVEEPENLESVLAWVKNPTEEIPSCLMPYIGIVKGE